MSNDAFDQALKIALAIGRMIDQNGGTSRHKMATELKLPASLFDAIVAGSERLPMVKDPKYAGATNTLAGITLRRGDDDATIQARAKRETGGLDRR